MPAITSRAAPARRLHLVDRWGRLAIVWFFAGCVAVMTVVLALHPRAGAPAIANYWLGLAAVAVATWFYPLGRHVIVTAKGLSTWRQGSTAHGQLVLGPAAITRLDVVDSPLFARVEIVGGHQTIVATRFLRLGGRGRRRAEAVVAAIRATLGPAACPF